MAPLCAGPDQPAAAFFLRQPNQLIGAVLRSVGQPSFFGTDYWVLPLCAEIDMPENFGPERYRRPPEDGPEKYAPPHRRPPTRELVLRPKSSNGFFYRRKFPRECVEKSNNMSRRRSAASTGIANNGRSGLAINFIPVIAISNQSTNH